MGIESHRMLIGSAGWQHTAWQAGYYPEDLPPEWRLGFYANEFPAVLVRAQDGSPQDLLAELVDCKPDFMLLVEADVREFGLDRQAALDCVQQRARLAAALDAARAAGEHRPQCPGLLLVADALQLADPEFMAAMLRPQAGMATPVPVLALDAGGQPPPAQLQALLRERRIGWSWSGQPGTERDPDRNTDRNMHEDGKAGLLAGKWAIVAVPAACDLKPLGKLVAAALAASRAGRQTLLLFRGAPPDIELMRQAGLMESLF